MIKSVITCNGDFERVEVRLLSGRSVYFDVEDDTPSYVGDLITAAEEYLEWRKAEGLD